MDGNFFSLMQRLTDETAAYQLLEELRWDGVPVCPHCGSKDEKHYFLKPRDGARQTRTGATTYRRLWKCRDCRKQFSALTGTVMHGSKIAVRIWLLVMFEMCASKNGVSTREIQRKYGLTEKSAWFMSHRIREAMRRDPLAGLLSGVVVADETWIGGEPKNRHGHRYGQGGQGRTDKTPVMALVDKQSGEVRGHVIPNVRGTTLRRVLMEEVDAPRTTLHTDGAASYAKIAPSFAGHEAVDHAIGEYVRGDASTNLAECYFSQLKRSIDGTHHAVSRKHLQRYVDEHSFRFSTRKLSDGERASVLVGRTAGRRLTYRPVGDHQAVA